MKLAEDNDHTFLAFPRTPVCGWWSRGSRPISRKEPWLSRSRSRWPCGDGPWGKELGRSDDESRIEFRSAVDDFLCALDYSSEDSEHGFGVVKAGWTADSQYFVFSLTSSGATKRGTHLLSVTAEEKESCTRSMTILNLESPLLTFN